MVVNTVEYILCLMNVTPQLLCHICRRWRGTVECRVPNRHLDVWASGRFSTGTEAGYHTVLYDTPNNLLDNLIKPYLLVLRPRRDEETKVKGRTPLCHRNDRLAPSVRERLQDLALFPRSLPSFASRLCRCRFPELCVDISNQHYRPSVLFQKRSRTYHWRRSEYCHTWSVSYRSFPDPTLRLELLHQILVEPFNCKVFRHTCLRWTETPGWSMPRVWFIMK